MAVKGEQEITQIGNTVTIKGDISGKSDVRIAGNVNGSVNIEGELIIEKSGYVEGEVKTINAVVAGRVKGNIDVAEKLVLESSSQYVGNIKTKQLIIQEGAVFQGNCQMGLPQTAVKEAPKA
ncbi:polymer-forming cytoskeletal protein [Fibrobacter sp. UWP2]|jgi:cytoskeletal protein CcmA (bactofilin family)|uniref:bactofilin family protein n=1 Tax=Fibrobacter sp. UWP2 TaxID=1896216 RepID=UPI00091C53CD|nr:polymer-forming cytoskeletal protein [Fibrobacter sp. UWP2]SHI88989.1 protein CcmA, bactofilin family [Fibrobacter sp. UWP2]